MNYYNKIENKLIDNEVYQKVKVYSKERNTVITYFEIGKLLSEAGSKYGENVIQKYSEKLVVEVGKKYNKRTLFRMKQFYNVFSNEKVTPLVTQLTWTHCLVLITIKDINKIYYYSTQVKIRNLSKRKLEEIIKNKEYERLPIETKQKLIKKEENKVTDFIKNPILIKNNYDYKEITEKILKQLILEDMDNFLCELGEDFCYIRNEYKIKIGNKYNYIDLLLYNIKYNCYIVVELKVTELKKEYIGQIQVYMNYIDKNIKKISQDKTIGIIICKKDNKFVLEYSSDDRIFETIYKIN